MIVSQNQAYLPRGWWTDRDSAMRYGQQVRNGGLAVLAAVSLAACSGVPDFSEMIPKAPSFSSYDWNPYTRASVATVVATRKVATAADMVNPDGTCAGAPAEASAEQAPTGVALQMTECNLVQVLGQPEKIEIAANERGDRTAAMLYSRGDRPGLYHFTSGQLTQIDRVAEPPPPPKPQKPAPQAKPRRAVT
jgi:hypothetical protein